MFSAVNATAELENNRLVSKIKSEAWEEADQAIAERAQGWDEGGDDKGGEGGVNMGDEKRGEGGDTMGDKKGGMEGSAGMPPEEATDQCRWFGTGMRGVDWGAGYQGNDTLDDESADHRSEYEGTGFEYDECHRKMEGPEYTEQFRPSETTLKSLPRFDENDLGRFSVDVIGQLALIFFNIMFPLKAIELLVDKTNEYFKFCTRDDIEVKNRQERHRKKKSFLGHARWPRSLSAIVSAGDLPTSANAATAWHTQRFG